MIEESFVVRTEEKAIPLFLPHFLQGVLLMSVPTESDCPSLPDARMIEQAIRTLKQSVAAHVEYESRLQCLCSIWQENWLSQCELLRNRIETLEARLAPWMAERVEGPRLAVISHQEDAA